MSKESQKIKLPKSIYIVMITTIVANSIATYFIINILLK
jgi:hypothetical protein